MGCEGEWAGCCSKKKCWLSRLWSADSLAILEECCSCLEGV